LVILNDQLKNELSESKEKNLILIKNYKDIENLTNKINDTKPNESESLLQSEKTDLKLQIKFLIESKKNITSLYEDTVNKNKALLLENTDLRNETTKLLQKANQLKNKEETDVNDMIVLKNEEIEKLNNQITKLNEKSKKEINISTSFIKNNENSNETEKYNILQEKFNEMSKDYSSLQNSSQIFKSKTFLENKNLKEELEKLININSHLKEKLKKSEEELSLLEEKVSVIEKESSENKQTIGENLGMLLNFSNTSGETKSTFDEYTNQPSVFFDPGNSSQKTNINDSYTKEEMNENVKKKQDSINKTEKYENSSITIVNKNNNDEADNNIITESSTEETNVNVAKKNPPLISLESAIKILQDYVDSMKN